MNFSTLLKPSSQVRLSLKTITCFRRYLGTQQSTESSVLESRKHRDIKGLYEFFLDGKKALASIDELQVGRSWRAAELRKKKFDDLHKLWYISLKERNMLATMKQEAKRFNKYEGPWAEAHKKRNFKCVKAMARIKFVLNERRVCYEYVKRTDPVYFGYRAKLEYEEKLKKEYGTDDITEAKEKAKETERKFTDKVLSQIRVKKPRQRNDVFGMKNPRKKDEVLDMKDEVFGMKERKKIKVKKGFPGASKDKKKFHKKY
ncbi:2920_t:CDS:2 [Ambispora gerdemannii]|uniref:Large ribosomal subunit protein uL29m n=1 Tax=Ambispora gerdemannii TaxID=144530 RepID=A0A9N8V0D3_9GLOM|nr:2920_t:CDS:2 [Ambispora gerdemannii]